MKVWTSERIAAQESTLRALVGKQIRECRDEGGWTQEEFGDLVGLAQGTVSAYERGASLPPLDALLRMCGEFRILLEDLVG